MADRQFDQLVLALWAAWRDRDVAAVTALITDDIDYSVNLPTHVAAYGGRTVGKRALADRLRTMAAHYEVLQFDGVVNAVNGNTIRGIVHFSFRHWVTGLIHEGSMRQVLTIQDGFIASLHTTVDERGRRAFMSLVAHKASTHA